MDDIGIETKRIIYDVTCTYHSDMKCQNYDARITGVEEKSGRISLEPDHCGKIFEFYNSDPDRVIAIAQMIMAFAQTIKNKSRNTIDANDNV